jgi:hypothetical protein
VGDCGEGRVESLEVPLEGRLAIQVKGSSDLPGDFCNGNVFTVELVFVVPEMMHANPPAQLRIANCRLQIANRKTTRMTATDQPGAISNLQFSICKLQ